MTPQEKPPIPKWSLRSIAEEGIGRFFLHTSRYHASMEPLSQEIMEFMVSGSIRNL